MLKSMTLLGSFLLFSPTVVALQPPTAVAGSYEWSGGSPQQTKSGSGAGNALRVTMFISPPSGADQTPRRCLAWLRLKFDRPVNLATLMGRVTISSYGHHPRPFIVVGYDQSFSEIILKAPDKGNCEEGSTTTSLELSDAIFAVNGQKLSKHVTVALPYEGQKSMENGRVTIAVPVPADIRWTQSGLTGATPAQQPELRRVSAADLNRAFESVKNWTLAEQRQPFYRDRGLIRLPLDDLNLKPFNATSVQRQYGSADTIFVIRRAAQFVSALFPDLGPILVADLSDSRGNTPSVFLGKEKIYLHPVGSHVAGMDADVTYLSTNSQSTKPPPFNMEMSFWYLYSVLQSSGVDMVITAYKQQFVAMARTFYQRGLISDLAAGRFNMLMEDHELNHEKHVHINVSNANNQQKSRKFTLNDDVYSCYLALKSNLKGAVFNFCAN